MSADGMNPKPVVANSGPAFCRESRNLLDAFGETVQEMLLLHELNSSRR